MPIVKISQVIGSVAIGDVLEVHTTDPGSLADFPAWAKTTGQAILETKQEPGVIKIFVKRQK
jgi:TusA-related sulfurtransferase